jgi:hypothetical protein
LRRGPIYGKYRRKIKNDMLWKKKRRAKSRKKADLIRKGQHESMLIKMEIKIEAV